MPGKMGDYIYIVTTIFEKWCLVMVAISIDPNLCVHDGICVQTCSECVFVQKNKDLPPDPVRSDLCNSCGQCVAICPHGALSHSDFPRGLIHEVEKDSTPDYEQLIALMRNRRAYRYFNDSRVSEEEIKKIIEAARYAPTALNAQGTRYLVIQDPLVLTEISEFTRDRLMRMIQEIRKNHKDSDLSKDHTFNVISQKISEIDDERDLFLHSATALLIFYTGKEVSMSGINANLALQNAALAAETLGIGAFYAGFVLYAIRNDPPFKKKIGIPDDCEIHGCLAIGYPKIRFEKWIERKPVEISWK
jgi:nitroreductase/ferredoxin